MKPDVIVTWPRSHDYPLWRALMKDQRDHMNEIIVSWMETNQGYDYRPFIVEKLFPDHVMFVQPAPVLPGEDWRHVAVRAALLHTLHSEWIWFTEQDFFPNLGFWDEVDRLAGEGNEVIGIYDQERLHPACLFIKRNILEKTSKRFGIVPNELDHFGLIQKDIEQMDCQKATIDESKYIHMAGLTHNMTLVERGEAPNYKVEQFNEYLRGIISLGIEVDPHWKEMVTAYLDKVTAAGNPA